MKFVRLLLVALVVGSVSLAAGPGPAAADTEGQPVLSASLADARVTPGEDTAMEVALVNEGRVTEADPRSPSLVNRVTTARGLTAEVTAGSAPIEVRTDRRAVGSLPEGSTSIPFEISVADDASPGTYRVPVNVRYTYTSSVDEDDGAETTRTRNQVLFVSLRIEPDAELTVRDVSTAARVGGSGTLALTVENTGSAAANDASLELDSANADLTFAGSPTAARSLGDWEPGERRTVEYTLTPGRNAEAQPYSVDVTAAYRDDDGIPARSETRTVAVVPDPELSVEVSEVSSTLSVGSEGDVTGTVTNTGDAEIRNAVVQFVSQKATVTALENEAPVGTLAPGESAEFSIPLEISESAEAGPKQYTFSVTYRDRDGDRRESESFDVGADVGPDAPEFDVSVEGATVAAGSQTQIRMSITNADDQRLTDVSANLFADDPVSTVDDEAFVNGLDPGDSATLTFSVSAGAGALAKEYPLSVDFQYDEPDGDTVVSDTYKVPLTVERGDGGGPPLVPLVALGLLLVAAAAVAYRRYS